MRKEQNEEGAVSVNGEEYSISLEHPVKYHYSDKNYNNIEGNHMYGPTFLNRL